MVLKYVMSGISDDFQPQETNGLMISNGQVYSSTSENRCRCLGNIHDAMSIILYSFSQNTEQHRSPKIEGCNVLRINNMLEKYTEVV